MPAVRLAEASLSPLLSHVWSGSEMGAQQGTCVPTGHAPLDVRLPGEGWPQGGAVEVLQSQQEDHVWRLLLPALAQAVKTHAGPVVIVNAPRAPFIPALRAHGLGAQRLLAINADQHAARLWATEQALRCAEVAAVLAWLPQVRSAELRRLHLASCQQERMFFVFRPEHAQVEASPARLRLRVEGNTSLKVHIVKRSGPPLASPVLLPAQSGRLAELLKARKGKPVTKAELPAPTASTLAHVVTHTLRSADALDRTAVPT